MYGFLFFIDVLREETMKKILLSILFIMPSFAYGNVLLDIQQELNRIAHSSQESVVNVSIVREETAAVIEPEFFFGYIVPSEKIYKYETGGIGSGFIVDERGYVLTNYHVIEGASKIKVEMTDKNGEKKEFDADIAGGDENLDIAVIKIKSNDKFPYLVLADTDTSVGDFVIAVGYPFGFKQTFTTGIVSSTKVNLKIEGRIYNSLIQTNAAINKGNSGGPLLNINGNVIGMNSAIYSPNGAFAGLGFAIPSWQIKRVIDEVIYNKKPARAWLGVYLLPTDKIIRSKLYADVANGGIINKVENNSPAERAGLKRGDIIVSMDGDDIETNDDLISKIYLKNPGDEIRLVYIRQGKKNEVRLKLEKKPDDYATKLLDKNVNTATSSDSYTWKGITVKQNNNSVYVLKIDPNSPFRVYLREGDIIKSINNITVDSLNKAKDLLKDVKLSEGILFDIERNGEKMYISMVSKE